MLIYRVEHMGINLEVNRFVDKTYDQQRELSDKGYATYSFESNLGLYYLQPDKLETVTEKRLLW